MKKLITLLAAMAIFGSISAQSKTAYLDLYQRGGAQHLRTTLIFNKKTIYLGKKNLGEVLNMLAESGWEVDKILNVRRLGITRHKFHVVLKKEYQAGENPFAEVQTNVIKSLKQERTPMQESYSNQENVTIQENVTVIKNSAFYKKKGLKEIHIPNSIVKIGRFAFALCLNLKAIYCEPLTPPELGFDAFYGIPKDVKIYVPRAAEKAYKEAKRWKKYADKIVGYDF